MKIIYNNFYQINLIKFNFMFGGSGSLLDFMFESKICIFCLKILFLRTNLLFKTLLCERIET